jgi:hypothetical protein
MKKLSIIATCALLLLSGCGGEETVTFTPLQGGFGYATHTRGYIDKTIYCDLEFQDVSGKRTPVWPNLMIVWGNNIQIHNDLAVFIGGHRYWYPRGNAGEGEWGLTKRLMAFKGPAGRPLDITDEIVKHWRTENPAEREKAEIIRDGFVGLRSTDDALLADFPYLTKEGGRIKDHDGLATVTWQELEAIAADVGKNGTVHKEKGTDTEYLQKD